MLGIASLETPDHVLEEVDEAAIYSEDDWEGEIASIEAASDAEEDLKDAGGEPPYGLDDAFGRVKGYVGDFDIRPPDA